MADENVVYVEGVCVACKEKVKAGQTVTWLGDERMLHTPTCPREGDGRTRMMGMSDEEFGKLTDEEKEEVWAEASHQVAAKILSVVTELVGQYGDHYRCILCGLALAAGMDLVDGLSRNSSVEEAKLATKVANKFLRDLATADGRRRAIYLDPESLLPPPASEMKVPEDRPTREPGGNVTRLNPWTRRRS